MQMPRASDDTGTGTRPCAPSVRNFLRLFGNRHQRRRWFQVVFRGGGDDGILTRVLMLLLTHNRLRRGIEHLLYSYSISPSESISAGLSMSLSKASRLSPVHIVLLTMSPDFAHI